MLIYSGHLNRGKFNFSVSGQKIIVLRTMMVPLIKNKEISIQRIPILYFS